MSQMSIYDLLIVGGGPAGLTAGIYGARSGLKTLVLEKGAVGGMAFTTRELINYPGFFKETTGPAVMEAMAEHARTFGAEIGGKEEAVDFDLSGEVKIVRTNKNREYRAGALILAPGSEPRLLNIPGERELRGCGVSYCATCDAEFYRDLDVVVVGNGDAAIEEAIYIAKFARKVRVIVIHDEGVVDCNRLSAGRAFKNPRIEFVWNSVLAEIRGGEEVEGAVLRNLKTNALTEIAVSGVFIYVGMTPKTALLRNKVELSAAGCILTNDRMETSVEGVFAAGDVREKAVRQVVTAASDGAIAAVSAERYLAEMATFREEVLEGSAPVLLAFWEPAARGCIEALARIENSLAPLAARVKLVKIDVSRKKEIARMYGVSAVPSALLLSGGEKIADLSGCLPPGGNLEAGMAAALERGGVNAEAAGTN